MTSKRILLFQNEILGEFTPETRTAGNGYLLLPVFVPATFLRLAVASVKKLTFSKAGFGRREQPGLKGRRRNAKPARATKSLLLSP